MCKHGNIIVTHYAFHVEGEPWDRIACEIKCADCDYILIKSDDLGVEVSYEYIKNNKDNINSLIDLTCDKLNSKYNIKDGLSLGVI